jgi:hypothetical protein
VNRMSIVASAAALALWTLAVHAHHSPAMFDADHQMTLSGTVREFQWTSPHCYIQLLVTNTAGADEEWSLEMGAPLYLRNAGWNPTTLKAGDRIHVTILPLRAGGRGGLVLGTTGADGKSIGRQP